MATGMTGPLSGLRVLDLVSVVMGPYATQILGDLGAEVISVEVATGDPLRILGRGNHPQLSGTALNVLRNKRNVSLDLKAPAGREAFLRLAATCDVFVTNVRPRALRKLGLAYEDLARVRPDVVYCEAHGFAATSPRADEAAYDDVIQGSAGVVELMSNVSDRPALAPFLLADKVCGLTIVYSVLAAVHHRTVTGQGQRVEVPMHDTVEAFMLVEHGADAIVRPPHGPPGYDRLTTPHHRPYETSDGVIIVIPYSRRNWLDLFAAAGRDATDDPRLADPATMARHYDDLYRDLAEVIATRSTEFWLAWGPEHSVPTSRVAALADLVDALPEADHPVSGRHKVIPPPVRFSATPQSVRRPAPLVGQHTAEVLAEIGYSADEIAELARSGAATLGG